MHLLLWLQFIKSIKFCVFERFQITALYNFTQTLESHFI